MSKPITEAEVHAICNEINTKDRKKPVHRLVRDRLKDRGSFSTIVKYVNTWVPPDDEAEQTAPVPDAVADLGRDFAKQLWAVARPLAERRAEEQLTVVRAERDNLVVHLQQMTATANEYATENDGLSNENATLREQKAELVGKLDDINARNAERDIKILALETVVRTMCPEAEGLQALLTKPSPATPPPHKPAKKPAAKPAPEAASEPVKPRQMDLSNLM